MAVRWLSLSAVLFGVYLVTTFCILNPPEYFFRIILWGPTSDVCDYDVLPAVTVNTAPPAHQFVKKPDERLVSSGFEKIDAVAQSGGLEKFLETTGTTSFIVIRDDVVLYERYFQGYPYSCGYPAFSVTKSYVSALVGIAVQEGYIHGIQDPITEYLPELKARDSRFESITIAHLLSMSSGLRFTPPFGDFELGDDIKANLHPDLRRVLLDKTIIAEAPGMHFLYKAYDPQLLSLILERATGMPASEYLQEKIWKPLHMEYPATWLIDSRESGLVKGEMGINARPMDYARFGRLYLENGNWEGGQILSPEWVSASTRPNDILQWKGYYPPESDISEINSSLFKDGRSHAYYGYLWWGFSMEDGRNDFTARGHLGQWIYISPAKNLIIVRTGTSEGGEKGINALVWLKIFYSFAGDL